MLLIARIAQMFVHAVWVDVLQHVQGVWEVVLHVPHALDVPVVLHVLAVLVVEVLVQVTE